MRSSVRDPSAAPARRTPSDELTMDREHLADGLLLYVSLRSLTDTPGLTFRDVPFPSSTRRHVLNQYFHSLTTKMSALFEQSHFVGHSNCHLPDCNSTLVVDGLMKLRRATCAAKLQGFTAVPLSHGRQARVLVGCSRTPASIDSRGGRSIFCDSHVQQASDWHKFDGTPNWTAPVKRRLSQNEYYIDHIVSWKLLDGALHFRVRWEGYSSAEDTWQRDITLPTSLTSTFQRHIDEIQSPDFCGLYINPDGSGTSERLPLRCSVNKEKDHQNAMYRTAGIVAFGWACGTICSVEELFRAESLTQIYAVLLRLAAASAIHPDKGMNAVRRIVYDDGCHLSDFIASRKHLPFPEAQQLSSKDVFIDRLHI